MDITCSTINIYSDNIITFLPKFVVFGDENDFISFNPNYCYLCNYLCSAGEVRVTGFYPDISDRVHKTHAIFQQHKQSNIR